MLCLPFIVIAAITLASPTVAQDPSLAPDQNTVNRVNAVISAHGLMMAIAFAILFPLGAIGVRLFRVKNLVWFHVVWQVFSLTVALAGMGMGVWLAVFTDQLTGNNGHPIIGIVVIGLLCLQPILGLLHHDMFKRTEKHFFWAITHVWLGRVGLILGVINGGLGLQLAQDTDSSRIISYSVIAAVLYLAWFATALLAHLRSNENSRHFETGVKVFGGKHVRQGIETPEKHSDTSSPL